CDCARPTSICLTRRGRRQIAFPPLRGEAAYRVMPRSCPGAPETEPGEQRTVEDALTPREQDDDQEAAEGGKAPIGEKAQPLRQEDEQPSAGQRPYPDRRAAEDDREHEVDRALETEIARLDIDVMMSKQRAGDCSDGRA